MEWYRDYYLQIRMGMARGILEVDNKFWGSKRCGCEILEAVVVVPVFLVF
jgi:hypothetical protein